MKDQLEDFIFQNKGAFDDKEPSEKVWYSIKNELFTSPTIWNSVVLWRAAAVLFFGLSIFLLISKMSNTQDKNLALNEFKDIETYYFSQISEKVYQIEEHRGQDGLNGFTRDFHQLDAMYQVLKEEMKIHPSQKVKDALVLNLLIRIDLLNQQLHKIDVVNSTIKEGEVNV